MELPNPEDISLEDIAHGLANTCRYAGQSGIFYSVAEHAVLVSERLRRRGAHPRLILAGLHHDDPEAFLGDLTRPLKTLLPHFHVLEEKMWAAIKVALDINCPTIDEPAVKEADNWALAAEAYYLLPSKGINWIGWEAGTYDHDLWPLTLGQVPAAAESTFLYVHNRCVEDVRFHAI